MANEDQGTFRRIHSEADKLIKKFFANACSPCLKSILAEPI
jgi:hypothetical protein